MLVQPLNFAIFDIVLISLVFHFSSDVAGRLNDGILRHGSPERLHINSPPVIGGGLVSTRKFHVFLLLFVRIVGLALILASELTLNGVTAQVPHRVTADVMVPGSVRNFTREQYQESVIRRTGCSATYNDSIYYGMVVDKKCITDVNLVFKDSLKLSTFIINRTIGFGAFVHTRRREDVAEIWYERGIMQCRYFEGEIMNKSCRGVFRTDNVTYLSELGAIRPNMTDEPTQARVIDNYDWRDERWLEGVFIESDINMVDAIHAVYGAAQRNMEVTLNRAESHTLVSVLWLVALICKILIVLALAGAIVLLKWKGYRVVVNDERRLVELLRRRIEEADPRLTRDGESNIFLNASRQSSNRRLHIVAAGSPGAPAASTLNAASASADIPHASDINWAADHLPYHSI